MPALTALANKDDEKSAALRAKLLRRRALCALYLNDEEGLLRQAQAALEGATTAAADEPRSCRSWWPGRGRGRRRRTPPGRGRAAAATMASPPCLASALRCGPDSSNTLPSATTMPCRGWRGRL